MLAKKLIAAVILLLPAALTAQNGIKLVVLDGKSGRPVTSSRFIVLWEKDGDGSASGTTDKHGEAAIAISHPSAVGFRIYLDWQVGCVSKTPAFNLQSILKAGVVAENTCSTKQRRPNPIPGVLVFYSRPMTFLEKMAS